MRRTRVLLAARSLYEVLGVSGSASTGDVKMAWLKKCKELHPDKFVLKSDAEQLRAKKAFQELSEAYRVLGNADLRFQYDQHGRTSHGMPNEDMFRQNHKYNDGYDQEFYRRRAATGSEPGFSDMKTLLVLFGITALGIIIHQVLYRTAAKEAQLRQQLQSNIIAQNLAEARFKNLGKCDVHQNNAEMKQRIAEQQIMVESLRKLRS